MREGEREKEEEREREVHLRCNETKPCEVSFTEVNWKQVLHITVGQHSVRETLRVKRWELQRRTVPSEREL